VAQDVIDHTEQVFSRHGQSDWLRSLKRVARAQALCWASTPITERRKWLALVDAEDELIAQQQRERVMFHEQQ
jgi:hypothetical protein